MNRPDAHPIELALLAGLLLIEALLTVLRLVLVPAAATLLLVMPRRRPAAPAPAPASVAAPEATAAAAEAPLAPVASPCLAGLAQSLLELPAAQLRELAGTRRRMPKRELTALICAMPI